ncbi:MAG: hypothetical protein ACI8RZ_001307 [Myxococcota bacterium]|jgi:hypothetical protein
MSSRPWSSWLSHFTTSARRPLPDLSAMPMLPDGAGKALAASLAIFQLGESGEGRIAHQIDHTELSGIDDDYRAALKLFVAEEGRHARILGRMVRAMGGELLEKSWTEAVFRHGRRMMGVRLKLLVLLAAEVIAIVFYGALTPSLPHGPLRAALEEITADEDHHLQFHAQFFATQTTTALSRTVFRILWWAGASAACLAVAWDHRATMRLLGAPWSLLVSGAIREIRRVEVAVLQPAEPQSAEAGDPLPGSVAVVVSGEGPERGVAGERLQRLVGGSGPCDGGGGGVAGKEDHVSRLTAS